jgi:hypothetical protein
MEFAANQPAVQKKESLDPLAYLRRSAISTFERAQTIYSQYEEAGSRERAHRARQVASRNRRRTGRG